MVTIDEALCIGCGACVDICHEHRITLEDSMACLEHELCNTCTQCIAVCPQQALSWEGVLPMAFSPRRLPTPDKLDELFKERRTIRRFRDETLDRALVEGIVNYGIYAPAK